MVNLSEIPTSKLTDELLKREGISSIKVAPYQAYEVCSEDKVIKDVGPAILIVNTD